MPVFLPLIAFLAASSGQSNGAPQVEPPLWRDLSSAAPSDDISGWKGWGYLKGGAGKWLSPGLVYGFTQPADKDTVVGAPVFRLKVFISVLKTTLDGPWLNRQLLLDRELKAVRRGLERSRQLIRTAFDGQIDLQIDETTRQILCLDSESERAWQNAQLDGYGYEADDRQYRGPYHAVLSIGPGVLEEDVEPLVLHAVDSGLTHFASLHGFSMDTTSPAPDLATLKSVLSFVPSVPTEEARNRTVRFGDPITGLVPVRSFHTSNVQLSLTDDSDRGKILHYVELGGLRRGGFFLPAPPDGFAPGSVLSFWLRTTSKDLVAVRAWQSDPSAGGQPSQSILVGKDGVKTQAYFPFKPDGSWQHVAVPLGQDPGPISGVEIGAAEEGREKNDLHAVDVDFDDFELSKDDGSAAPLSPQPSATSEWPLERMLQLEAYAKGNGAVDKTQIPTWLSDPDDSVRRRAIELFGAEPEAEAKLQDNAFNIEGYVSAAALDAMAQRGGDLDWQTIRRALELGAPLRRIEAARLLAPKGEEMANISAFSADRDPDVRREGAVAIGSMPGDVAAQILTIFFDDPDPYVSAAAVTAASADNALVARGLLYASVNSPWDAVRVAALLKMAQSSNDSLRREGWKGVRDDSDRVRAEFISGAPADRPEFAEALKAALADRFPSVRAAALRRYASLDRAKRPSEDLSLIYSDVSPEVVSALADAVKLKQLDAPSENKSGS